MDRGEYLQAIMDAVPGVTETQVDGFLRAQEALVTRVLEQDGEIVIPGVVELKTVTKTVRTRPRAWSVRRPEVEEPETERVVLQFVAFERVRDAALRLFGRIPKVLVRRSRYERPPVI
jgi:hypothetical protein